MKIQNILSVDNKMKIKDWWYDNETLFNINFEVSLLNIVFSVNLLFVKFNVKTNFPHFFDYWTSIYDKTINLTKNKSFEMQIMFQNNLETGIKICKYIHRDHAQFNFEIKFLGFSMVFTIYDHRHWDKEENNYKKYGK